MDTQPAPRIPSAQFVVDGGRLCLIVPLTYYLSGVVFFQYVMLCWQQQPSKRRPVFCIAKILVTTHAIQIGVELWTAWATIMSYLSGQSYSFLLDQSIETGLTAVIVLLVQYHFCRIAHTMSDSNVWLIFTKAIMIASFSAAMGAAFRFAKVSQDGQLHESAPLALDVTLLGLYIAWLALNCLVDVTINVKLGKALYFGLKDARQKSIRCLLRRLFTVTINMFSVTCLAACSSLVLNALPFIVPMSSQTDSACQAASYTINRSLSRIYLIPFFFSLISGKDSRLERIEFHVASLKMIRNSNNHVRASIRAVHNL